jgi:DUF1365 family protein
MISLSDLPRLQDFKWFSYNKNNVFQLRDRDYGFEKTEALDAWARRAAAQQNVQFDIADIKLITMPRTFGYGFNPVTFWCYFDAQQQLRAVMAEVRNTFHQRHCYWCMHDDGRAILPTDSIMAQKLFHVSPFFDMAGTYHFQFSVAPERVAIVIDYWAGEQKRLSATLSGELTDLTDAALWRSFWRQPWATLKTILLIHGHAILLLCKGMRYRAPAPLPAQDISR